MSLPQPSLPVKPVVSLITSRRDLAPPALRHLTARFGPPDLIGPWWPFTITDYYTPEMGQNLERCLVAFLHLADPAGLSSWKLFTNTVEVSFTLGGRRLINLDPGYVAQERLVLATGKNYSHRLYLCHGIYGDLTLKFAQRDFRPLPWSYPDYAGEPLRRLLLLVRKKYLWQLHQLKIWNPDACHP